MDAEPTMKICVVVPWSKHEAFFTLCRQTPVKGVKGRKRLNMALALDLMISATLDGRISPHRPRGGPEAGGGAAGAEGAAEGERVSWRGRGRDLLPVCVGRDNHPRCIPTPAVQPNHATLAGPLTGIQHLRAVAFTRTLVGHPAGQRPIRSLLC
jgi:hypothetical protein